METQSSALTRRTGVDPRQLQSCIDHCTECREVCLEAVAHSLERGGRLAERDHLILLLNCAQICQTAADFMITGSHLHIHTCRACAVVCRAVEETSHPFEADSVIKRCIDLCRLSAESCEEMAAGH